LPEVTAYAGGTALQGLALGIFAGRFVPWGNAWLPWAIIGTAYVIGAVLTMRGFSRLKRNYRIVPIAETNREA
jgi:hypothetical protein